MLCVDSIKLNLLRELFISSLFGVIFLTEGWKKKYYFGAESRE